MTSKLYRQIDLDGSPITEETYEVRKGNRDQRVEKRFGNKGKNEDYDPRAKKTKRIRRADW